jgi:hypothetical protein
MIEEILKAGQQIVVCSFKPIEKLPANRRLTMRVFTQSREFTPSDALYLSLSSTT